MLASLLLAAGILTIVALLAGLIWIKNQFKKIFKNTEQAFGGDQPSPLKALIVLSLRGGDPFLPQTLRAILNQRHENFILQIIVDHESDPAARIVSDFLAEQPDPRVKVEYLKLDYQTCGLKNCALVQASQKLTDEIDVLVSIDADAVPAADWLDRMISPLRNPEIGACSGLRWFSPANSERSDLIRFIWGANAMMQMVPSKMMWGGSLSIRREIACSTELHESWIHSLVDDLVIGDVAKKLNYRTVHVPVVLFNSESISFTNCLSFIQRQFFFVKVTHNFWRAIMISAALSGFSVIALLLSILCVEHDRQLLFTAIAIASFMIYALSVQALIRRVDLMVRSRSGSQESLVPPPPRVRLTDLFATLGVFLYCTLNVAISNKVNWRGITYTYSGRSDFQRLNYSPYSCTSLKEDATII